VEPGDAARGRVAASDEDDGETARIESDGQRHAEAPAKARDPRPRRVARESENFFVEVKEMIA
jgi:hypothetical protein